MTKLNLHKIATKEKTPIAFKRFKDYRNLYNKILRASKKLYYNSELKKTTFILLKLTRYLVINNSNNSASVKVKLS